MAVRATLRTLPIASIRIGCRTTSTGRRCDRYGIRSTPLRHVCCGRPTRRWRPGPCWVAWRRAGASTESVSVWGVTDTGKRHPAVTAQAAATLNLMTRGRAILGIGPGERVGNEPYGVDWSKPVARFEEALATIRALWSSKGKLVKRDSPFIPLRDAIFDLPSYKGRWPEIWVAAHGPRMPGQPDATATRGSRASLTGRRITPSVLKSSGQQPPMPGAIRCRLRRPCGCR